MEKDRIEKIRSIYGLVLALFSVVVGLLFIVQTWRIYTSAPQSPYSTERIQEMFRQIAIPVWTWIILVVAGGVFVCVYPEEKGRPKAYLDLKLALVRAKKRLPNGEYSAEIVTVERREEKFRGYIVAAVSVVCVALLFVSLAVVCNLFHVSLIHRPFFTAHDGLVDRLFQAAILALLALGAVAIGGIFLDRSRRKEQKAYLDILVRAKKGEAPIQTEAPAKKCACKEKWSAFWQKINFWTKLSAPAKKKAVLGIRIGLGVLGVTFIVLGIANGGMKDVLLKAINICTQCIGLG